jgi:transposase
MISAVLERCAGIDVGKKMLAVCVLAGPADGEARQELRTFGTNVEQLKQLREWLCQENCTHAVMESTGTYWKPVFNILEESIEVVLANPHEVKARKGHKTDHKDAWWLAHLLRHGMITPSFIPPRPQRDLRDLTRRRRKLIQTATGEKNRIDKVLQDANVKLSDTLTDIFGVSGQLMLEALLKGKADPAEIADFAKGAARKKIPEIIASLEQHQMREHHRTMIRYSLDHLKFLEEQLNQIDDRIREGIIEAGYQKQWELLQTLPGVLAPTAAVVLAEVGPDVNAFATEKKLSSWAGVAPGNNRSAGKSKSSGITKGNLWLRAAMTESAWANSKKKSGQLKEKFRRIAAKSRPKAVVAVAHDLLILTWHVLHRGTPYEEKRGVPMSPEQQQRLIRHHVHKLGKLGIRLKVPQQPVSQTKGGQTRASVTD